MVLAREQKGISNYADLLSVTRTYGPGNEASRDLFEKKLINQRVHDRRRAKAKEKETGCREGEERRPQLTNHAVPVESKI
jgi:hypothetical protein